VTFILGNKAGGKENLLPALYFLTIVQLETIFLAKNSRDYEKTFSGQQPT